MAPFERFDCSSSSVACGRTSLPSTSIHFSVRPPLHSLVCSASGLHGWIVKRFSQPLCACNVDRVSSLPFSRSCRSRMRNELTSTTADVDREILTNRRSSRPFCR